MPAKRNIARHCQRLNYRGFTLIEVLIALVVLAVGILGVAGMQGNSLRHTHSASLQTQANQIAIDMAERLRTNRDYSLANPATYAISPTDTAGSLATNCDTTVCTTAELAVFDRNQWLQALNTLPSGKGEVSVDAATRDAVIKVMWDNDRTGAEGTSCSGNSAVDLTCFELTVKP